MINTGLKVSSTLCVTLSRELRKVCMCTVFILQLWSSVVTAFHIMNCFEKSILYRYSSEMSILSGCSAIWRSPFPKLKRCLSKCCRNWSWPIPTFSLSSKTVKNLQSGLFFIDAAVMWPLEPLWMTIYIHIDIPL